jgi:DNA-binding protein HU-beta
MNKLELVQKMADISDLSQADCKKALETFMEIVIDNLKNHHNTSLLGFGTFTAFKRKDRIGINPQTKKKMNIPGYYITKFRPAKSIKKLSKI